MTKSLPMGVRTRAMYRLAAGETARAVDQALAMVRSRVVKPSQRRRVTGGAAAGELGGRALRRIGGQRSTG